MLSRALFRRQGTRWAASFSAWIPEPVSCRHLWEEEILKAGIIPPELSPRQSSVPACDDCMKPPGGVYLYISGVDMVGPKTVLRTRRQSAYPLGVAYCWKIGRRCFACSRTCSRSKGAARRNLHRPSAGHDARGRAAAHRNRPARRDSRPVRSTAPITNIASSPTGLASNWWRLRLVRGGPLHLYEPLKGRGRSMLSTAASTTTISIRSYSGQDRSTRPACSARTRRVTSPSLTRRGASPTTKRSIPTCRNH